MKEEHSTEQPQENAASRGSAVERLVMPLPKDVCRCEGHDANRGVCERRDSCARYTQRKTSGTMGAFYLCHWSENKQFMDFFLKA